MSSPKAIDSSIELVHVQTTPQDGNDGGSSAPAPVSKSSTRGRAKIGIHAKQSTSRQPTAASGGNDGGDPPKRPNGNKRKLPEDAPAFIRLRKRGTF